MNVLRDYLISRKQNINYFSPEVYPSLSVEVPMNHEFQAIFIVLNY